MRSCLDIFEIKINVNKESILNFGSIPWIHNVYGEGKDLNKS